MSITVVVGGKMMQFEEQVQSSTINHPLIIVGVIDVEPKSDVGQDLGILIDLMDSKYQGQEVLVELGYKTERKTTTTVKQVNYTMNTEA